MKSKGKIKDTGSVVARDNKGRAGRFVFRRLAKNGLEAQKQIETEKLISRKITTRLGQWNVRSLTGEGKPELLVEELKR